MTGIYSVQYGYLAYNFIILGINNLKMLLNYGFEINILCFSSKRLTNFLNNRIAILILSRKFTCV